jgi:hypothetical protein
MVYPAKLSRNTDPARLNWVRRALIDKGIPVVMICTPQRYDSAKTRFVKATKFAIEQFDTRIPPAVDLPATLCEDDLIAVVRNHFRDLPEIYLKQIADSVLTVTTPTKPELPLVERSYISDVAWIAKLAKDNAREHGRSAPLWADIQSALALLFPQQPGIEMPSPTQNRTSKSRLAVPMQRACSPRAEHFKAANSKLPVDGRGPAPVTGRA